MPLLRTSSFITQEPCFLPKKNNEFSTIFGNLLCHLSLDHMTCMTEPIITAGTPKKK